VQDCSGSFQSTSILSITTSTGTPTTSKWNVIDGECREFKFSRESDNCRRILASNITRKKTKWRMQGGWWAT